MLEYFLDIAFLSLVATFSPSIINDYHRIYCRTSVALTSLGPWKFVIKIWKFKPLRVNHSPSQEADGDNLGMSF